MYIAVHLAQFKGAAIKDGFLKGGHGQAGMQPVLTKYKIQRLYNWQHIITNIYFQTFDIFTRDIIYKELRRWLQRPLSVLFQAGRPREWEGVVWFVHSAPWELHKVSIFNVSMRNKPLPVCLHNPHTVSEDINALHCNGWMTFMNVFKEFTVGLQETPCKWCQA